MPTPGPAPTRIEHRHRPIPRRSRCQHGPRCRRRAGRPVTSRRPIRTMPPSSVSRPATIRSSVVLPQPLGPTSTRPMPARANASTSRHRHAPPAAQAGWVKDRVGQGPGGSRTGRIKDRADQGPGGSRTGCTMSRPGVGRWGRCIRSGSLARVGGLVCRRG